MTALILPPPLEPDYLELSNKRIAYHKQEGKGPTWVFLCGYMSDMYGSKAQSLSDAASKKKRSFLRFDYTGHGKSSGTLIEGTIGTWLQDAIDVIDHLTDGPLILIGSSLGGWLMLQLALRRPDRIAGLVGIASAPDFTENLIWQILDPKQKDQLMKEGIIHLPINGEEGVFPVTKNLIEEARQHLLLDGPIPIKVPVALLHGTEDKEVPIPVGYRLLELLESKQATLTLLKGGDHRLSRPQDIDCLMRSIKMVESQV